MTKPFKTLRKKMSLPARKAAAAKTKEMGTLGVLEQKTPLRKRA